MVTLTGDEAMFTPSGEATENDPVTLRGEAFNVTFTGDDAMLTPSGEATEKLPVTFRGDAASVTFNGVARLIPVTTVTWIGV